MLRIYTSRVGVRCTAPSVKKRLGRLVSIYGYAPEVPLPPSIPPPGNVGAALQRTVHNDAAQPNRPSARGMTPRGIFEEALDCDGPQHAADALGGPVGGYPERSETSE